MFYNSLRWNKKLILTETFISIWLFFTQANARKALDVLWERRQRGSDLVGTVINIHNEEWVRRGEAPPELTRKHSDPNVRRPTVTGPSCHCFQTAASAPASTRTTNTWWRPTFFWETTSSWTGSTLWVLPSPPRKTCFRAFGLCLCRSRCLSAPALQRHHEVHQPAAAAAQRAHAQPHRERAQLDGLPPGVLPRLTGVTRHPIHCLYRLLCVSGGVTLDVSHRFWEETWNQPSRLTRCFIKSPSSTSFFQR